MSCLSLHRQRRLVFDLQEVIDPCPHGRGYLRTAMAQKLLCFIKKYQFIPLAE